MVTCGTVPRRVIAPPHSRSSGVLANDTRRSWPASPAMQRPPRKPIRGATMRSHSPPNYSRSLPVRFGRAYLDRTAVPQCRSLRRELQRGVKVIALEDEIGADRLLDPDVWSLG